MNTSLSMWLGLAFLGLAVVAVSLQAWLWGPKFWDEAAKKTRAPKLWLRVHALAGYTYGAIYVVMMWNMVPRLWEYQYELPARTIIHAVVGITIGVLLLSKISILMFFRHFEESMPYYGFGLLLCTVVLTMLSIPYALRAHDFGGMTADARNVERVRNLLAKIDFGAPSVTVADLTSSDGFERGRGILVRKCTVCHDMRTILAKPRTPSTWYEVSERMLDKPSVFGEQLAAEDIPWVTSYLAAITPQIQDSLKRRRAAVRAGEVQTEAMVELARDASPLPAMTPVDATVGESLLQQHCTGCHELDELSNHGPDDAAGWRSVVAAMVEEGAEFDDGTAATLVAYLANKYPAPANALPPMPPLRAAAAEANTADRDRAHEAVTTVEQPGAPTLPDVSPRATPVPKKRSHPSRSHATESSEHDDTPAKSRDDKPAVPKTLAVNAASGRSIFMAKCKTCHGVDGLGQTPFGQKLGVPSLHGQSRGTILSVVVNGKPGTKMKSYKSTLTEQEILDVVAFVERL